MIEVVAFYFFSFLVIGLFAIVVTTSNVLYALSSLAFGMIFISAFFFLNAAEFLGIAQIIVYTGAVMALYAFAMMFFDALSKVQEKIIAKVPTILISSFIAIILAFILWGSFIGKEAKSYYPNDEDLTNMENIGLILFTKYLLAFELIAIILLIAIVGGIALATRKEEKNYDNS